MAKTAKPRKHGHRWEINWLDADRTRRFESHVSFKEAQRALNHHRAEAEEIRAGVRPRPPDPHTFGELCDYWLEHRTPMKRSQKDDRSIVRTHLRPAFGHLQLVQFNIKHVDRFIATRNHVSRKTLHNVLTLLVSMLNLAVELRWLLAAPTIKKPRLVEEDYRWLRTEGDIRALLVAAKREDPGVMELYACAVYSGLRAGELLGLRWTDVEFDRRLITVRRSYDKPTKTGAIRHVPILDPLLPVLRGWRLRGSGDVVFPGRTGKAQGPSARVLQEVLGRCLEDAKLTKSDDASKPPYDRLTFHDLRHSFASMWVMRGGDLYRLQRILGHKTVAMTQRYAHLAPDVFTEDWGLMSDVIPSDGDVVPFVPIDSTRTA